MSPTASEMIDAAKKRRLLNRVEFLLALLICVGASGLVVMLKTEAKPLPLALGTMSLSLLVIGFVICQVDKICRAIRGE